MNIYHSRGGFYRIFLMLCLLMPCLQINVFAQESVPEPLTLKYALSKADTIDSAELMSYSAQRQVALAEQELAISRLGIFVEVNGRLRYVEPASFIPDAEKNDSKISLDISKRLYDFGQSSANISATKKNLAALDVLYTDYVSQRTVAILQAYFNVLLADIVFNYANEAMAVDYVKLDKERSRLELKQISEIDFLAIDNDYRKTRRERSQAMSDQRLTRQRLAQLISPGQLSEQLTMPDLVKIQLLSNKRELPDVESLYALASEHNPRLIAQQHRLEAARFKLEAFQAEKYPVISAHIQAADYAREIGSSDRYRAGIRIKVPLYQAGQENSRIKREAGKAVQIEADRLLLKRELEQQILELWLNIANLKQQYSDPDLTMDFRDRYLERSRALYELEVTSDLGDAMVELSQAQLFKAQTVFELAISWAKLDALLGNVINYYE